MATRTSRKQHSKKAGVASAAAVGTPVAPVAEVTARPSPEVQTAVGLEGVTVEGGRANVAVSLDIPRPTMQENPKWPWTPWYVESLKKQVAKDFRRLAQTVANLEHVSRTVEAHAAARAVSKPAAVQTQPAGERPGVAQ